MFIFGNFLIAVAKVLDSVLWAYSLILFFWCIISWVSPDPFNPIVQFLRAVTEPVLSRIRQYMPLIGPFDFSVIVAFLLIVFLRSFLIKSLFDLGLVLR
ncbi:MAG: YggT family protein [Candidatus Omnitrophica bacterium]|nr:YggT family protein [Candidatus Omnitrophota bacterium]